MCCCCYCYVVGYVFRVTTQGGDGLKVRELSTKKMLYINVCSSKVLEPPIDSQGKKIEKDLIFISSPQIPLLVGPVRTLNESSNAIDIVVHPSVVECCTKHNSFRQEFAQLAREWVTEETGLVIDSQSYEEIESTKVNDKYMGGLGEKKDIPVLFHVTAAMLEGKQQPSQRDSKGKHSSSSNALSSTSSLLNHLNDSSSNEIPDNITLETKTSKSTAKIEEIGLSAKKEVIQEKKENKPKAPSGGMAKGFLNKKANASSEAKAPTKAEYQELVNLLEKQDEEFAGDTPVFDEINDDPSTDLLDKMARLLAGNDHLSGGLTEQIKMEGKATTSQQGKLASTSQCDSGKVPNSLEGAKKIQSASLRVKNPWPEICKAVIESKDNQVMISLQDLRDGANIQLIDIQVSDCTIDLLHLGSDFSYECIS